MLGLGSVIGFFVLVFCHRKKVNTYILQRELGPPRAPTVSGLLRNASSLSARGIAHRSRPSHDSGAGEGERDGTDGRVSILFSASMARILMKFPMDF